ncbi:MAG: acyl-CoA thioesterase [Gammaproteobacteria bacterium]|nr:acyl-CoA thioesterase [Gammaproteobacteria bacterium]NVK87971.1 acyl-CoA thioesterase [Gammaproteobacteria bacterium]
MSETLATFLTNYPVTIELPVQWGEMDAFAHVNNVVYFRYFESARLAFMEKTAIMSEMQRIQVGPILAHTECRYRRPLTYPDTITVGCRVDSLGEQDLIQSYAVWSHQQQTITTSGKARIVMVDYQSHQKVAISASIRAAILQLQPELAAQ